MPKRITILTGATGFLGRQILQTLLANGGDERILVIIRAKGSVSARARLADLLEKMFPDEANRRDAASRVGLIETDLDLEPPRLDGALRAELDGRACRIVHGAASVVLDQPLEVARNTNVGGTQRMLDFAGEVARIATLERFAYIGTAFVAGERTGVILEDELDVGQTFRNTYERSKCEAEALVRSYEDRLPITIFRPSIIAGHSTTGTTTSFKTIYWPLKVFTRGIVVCIPGDRDACYDLVPVDFVSEALLHVLARDDSVGRCFHLTAGRTITLYRAVRLTAEFFGVRRIPPFVPPRLFYPIVRPILYLALWGRWRKVLEKSRVIVPYLTCRLEFDNRNTRAALADSRITLPDVETYLKTVYHYAQQAGRAGPRATP